MKKNEDEEISYVAICDKCDNLCMYDFTIFKEVGEISGPNRPKSCIYSKKNIRWKRELGEMKLTPNKKGTPVFECEDCGFLCRISCLKQQLPTQCPIWNPLFISKDRRYRWATKETKSGYLDYLRTPIWKFKGLYDIKIE